MGLPRLVFLEANQDAWVSILIALLGILLVVFVMLRILQSYDNADILGIQIDLFGKWLGKIMGTVYIIYFALTLFSVLITYIEVVKIFIFPELSNFVMGLLLVSLIVYSMLGGLKAIIGVCFIFFLLSQWVLFLLIHPAVLMDFTHFQPVLQASFPELLSGARSTVYTLLGFEILFFIYPFIQNKKKAKKPVYFGVTFTALILLIITIISIGFFSPDQLKNREWVLLNLFKIQSLPFIERFDYIVVAEWMMVVVPTMLLLMWAITYSMKRLYRVPQKITLYATAGLMLIACIFTSDHFLIKMIINASAQYGFWLVFVYPLLLLPVVLIKKRWGKQKGAGRYSS